MPSEDELAHVITTLTEHNNTADNIATHCAPSLVQARFSLGCECDKLTDFLNIYVKQCRKTWYFGHHHEDRRFDDGFISLYDDVVPTDTTPKART